MATSISGVQRSALCVHNMQAKASSKLFCWEIPKIPAGDSPFVSVSETNTSVEDLHNLNLAVTNLDKRQFGMCNDFKVPHQEITQKFLAITAQLNSATSPSSSSVQILASNANNDAVGQLS